MKPIAAIPMFTALLLAVSAVLLPAQSHAQKSERHKLVLQVSTNDPAVWNLALNNAENVQEALGKDKIDIEIVAYGPGLNMLKAESKVAPPPQRRARPQRRPHRLRNHHGENEAHQGGPGRGLEGRARGRHPHHAAPERGLELRKALSPG